MLVGIIVLPNKQSNSGPSRSVSRLGPLTILVAAVFQDNLIKLTKTNTQNNGARSYNSFSKRQLEANRLALTLANSHEIGGRIGEIKFATSVNLRQFLAKSFKEEKVNVAPAQMAPDYEIWPDVKMNFAMAESNNNSNNNRPYQQQNHVATRGIRLNNNNLRSLLASSMAPSGTEHRRISRATKQAEVTEAARGRSGGDDAESGDEEDGGDSLDEAEVETETETETEMETETEDESPMSAASSDATLRPFDGQRALANGLKRRALPLSPVYPPGDAERLYSDALLVYTKDFNEFIRR